MKLHRTKYGFTLIELLVVITIIGILATGATAVYTSQIQKARDTTRINDIKALQSGVEQVYQDTGEYPHANTFVTEVVPYVEKFPADPKHGQPCYGIASTTQPECAYAYMVGNDTNGILFGKYEISSAFENSGNTTSRAGKDGGDDSNRLEIGINVSGTTTTVNVDAVTPNPGACLVSGAAASDSAAIIVINGNPTTAGAQCN